MGDLSQAKTYGGVGSILLLLSPFVPYAGIALFVAGIVLVLVAVKYISETLGDRGILNNMVVFVVLSIGAFAVLIFMVLGAVFTFIGFPAIFGGPIEAPDITEGDLIALIVALIIGVVVAWILYIVAAIFLKKSFDAIASGLGVNMFRTTALIFLIGAALLIIGIGAIVILVAGILQIVAFFSVPEQRPGVSGSPPMAETPPL